MWSGLEHEWFAALRIVAGGGAFGVNADARQAVNDPTASLTTNGRNTYDAVRDRGGGGRSVPPLPYPAPRLPPETNAIG